MEESPGGSREAYTRGILNRRSDVALEYLLAFEK